VMSVCVQVFVSGAHTCRHVVMSVYVQMLLAGARTQQEQIDSLLNEISDEVEIDARASDRLNQLKYDVSKSDISGLLQTNSFKKLSQSL